MMVSLQAKIRRWFADKDDTGRAILYISSQSDIEKYISHPERVPDGDLLIRSRVPLGIEMKRLLDVIGKTRRYGARVGIDAPPPIEDQGFLQTQAKAALWDDLQSAYALSGEALQRMRNRAFCSDDEDGFMLIPTYYGDAEFGRSLFAAVDIHRHGPCPLQGWLREELASFAPAAERHFGWTKFALEQEIDLDCVGGDAGLQPDLCMSFNQEDKFQIRISHVFYHVMLVAARFCAAQFRLSGDEPRKISEEEIDSSLRAVIALYDGTNAAPTTDAITAKLMPHQVLMVERFARGMRRFVVAHEIGHILLWKSGGQFKDIGLDWDSLRDLAKAGRAPLSRGRDWAVELGCDMLALKLLQETGPIGTGEHIQFEKEGTLQSVWDYASIRLWLTLWAHILHRMKLAGQTVHESHPLPQLRMVVLEAAFPAWVKEFGNAQSDNLSLRIASL